MTENELRRRVCDMAQSMNGRKESDGSHRAIIDLYNEIRPLPRNYRMTYEDPWCAAFVSAVGHACGLETILFPECACDPMIAKYKAAGRWEEKDGFVPSPGDVIFYDWQDSGQGDNVGSSDHVGLVLSVTGSTISVIEGNTGDMVAIRTRTVDQIYLRGYGLPDYAAAAAAGEAPPAEDPQPGVSGPDTSDAVTLPALPDGWHYVALPELQIGDGYTRNKDLKEAVRALQYLLKGRGFPVGVWGCDGELGRNTESAIGKYQGDRQLQKDGVCGPETWARIITERRSVT